MATDLELLERWRQGDRRAGNELIGRYFVDLRIYFWTRVPGEHEDLVQETFAAVLKGLHKFRAECAFKTYLYSIAYNLLAGHLRKRYRASFSPISDSLIDLTGQRQSSMLAERERHRLLLDSLRSLSLDDQDLLEHYYFERLTAPQLSELLGISIGGVRARIRTALGRLRLAYFKLAAIPHEREFDEAQLEAWLRELRDDLHRS